MHELGIAGEILAIALAEADRHGARRIARVDLLVGVLRGVVPEHLHFLFGHLAKGTIAEGATLALEEEPVRIDCETCGPIEAGGFTLACPACGRPCGGIRGGDSLRITSIDVDTTESRPPPSS